MRNIKGTFLPKKIARTVYFTGDPEQSFEEAVYVRPYGKPPVRLVLKNFTDWHLLDAFMTSQKRFDILEKGEPLPYDEVIVEANIGRRRWTFAKHTANGHAFAHCALPYGRGIILKL